LPDYSQGISDHDYADEEFKKETEYGADDSPDSGFETFTLTFYGKG
jgi:hypothetical protein